MALGLVLGESFFNRPMSIEPLDGILASKMRCVFDQGRVVERRTHRELLERKGLYARLHMTQAAPYQVPEANTEPAGSSRTIA